ncbi:hypothetical protein PQD13_gp77 [Gordonia phage Clawz]|uniref:Uncharacterized protein n=1 Tax=Gordonia phage Clawz TaxID=2743910 RepID=A0AAE7K6A2_9CAUD|nr:hypothetical protein PQD13_gp77 [Gordonia phage Clawz]QKY79989.1 hypothetical protein SEA_CLAWZ_77 [Gordonia phage Clawz]
MKIGVHFQSPTDDPLKIPRPLWLDYLPELNSITQRGGEIGNAVLIGLTPTYDPPNDLDDAEQWCDRDDILADALDQLAAVGETANLLPSVTGWHLNVGDETGIYTTELRVDRIEVAA